MEQAGIAADQVVGVGIVGVTHNVVLMDEHDKPLCRTILIFDSRSTAQVDDILTRWGDEVWKRTLNDVTPMWTWPQMLWLRQNRPEVWKATKHILFQKDYVRHRFAPAYITDVIDAGGTLFFDPVQETWIEPFCEDLELNPAWLPEVVSPFEACYRSQSPRCSRYRFGCRHTRNHWYDGYSCRGFRFWCCPAWRSCCQVSQRRAHRCGYYRTDAQPPYSQLPACL